MLCTVFLCAFLASVIQIAVGLDCYTCTNATSAADCKQTTTCPSGYVCKKGYTIVGATKYYTLGCVQESSCPANSSLHHSMTESSALVGRSVHARSTSHCTDCCRSSNCNLQLCQEDLIYCTDGASNNCNLLGASVNLCLDTSHAKSTCRRFCGLCGIVDGGWASWEQWPHCDVTCGNGTMTRARTCTDPVPSEGGDYCVGHRQETTTCTLELCPVHGGWTQWSAWGSCSSSCDIGMQRRDRTCSNPYPSRYGDHCFGDARDDRICLPGACADGGWSSWSTWSSCSSSCGKGLHMRSRTCDNPSPSVVGRFCLGNPFETAICKIRSCPEKVSAFTVTGASRSGSPLHFGTIKINLGSSYSTSTNKFTCRIPGLYYFTADLTKTRDSTRVDRVIAYIVKNGDGILQIQTDPTDDDTDKGSYEATGSIIVHLHAYDTVYVSVDTGTVESWSAFSGFLISPDP